MKRSFAGVTALGLVTLALPASAWAQDTGRRVVRHTMQSVTHEIVLPAGWDGKGEGDGFIFVPPAAKIKDPPYTVGLVAVERQAGFNATPKAVAEYLANDDKTKQHPTWETTEPDDMQFVGQAGAIMMLGGIDEGSSTPRAIVYVVSLAPKVIYYLRAEGSLEDTQSLFEDLAAIIGGVARMDTATKSQPMVSSVKVGAPPSFVDPVWGVAVTKLEGGWALSFEKDAYVLTAPNAPSAIARISREEPKNLKAYWRGKQKGARQGTLFGRTAWIKTSSGDRNSAATRTYYVESGKGVLSVELSSFDLDRAAKTRVPQLERAIKVSDPSAVGNKGGGASVTLFGGVQVNTHKKWSVDEVGAARMSFKGPRKVVVSVKVFESTGGDPWSEVPATARQQCELAGGKLEKSEIAVLGASKAFRFRCQAKDAAALLTLSEGKFDGKPVFVRTVSQYARRTNDLPDAETAEFMTFVRFSK